MSDGRTGGGNQHGELVVNNAFSGKISAKCRPDDETQSKGGAQYTHPLCPSFLIGYVRDIGLARCEPAVHNAGEDTGKIDHHETISEG